MPVLTFLSVTVAPGITPPDESRTVPSTVAASNWANAGAGSSAAATSTAASVRASGGMFHLIRASLGSPLTKKALDGEAAEDTTRDGRAPEDDQPVSAPSPRRK